MDPESIGETIQATVAPIVQAAVEDPSQYLIAYTALLVMALIPIYFASHHSASKDVEKESISSADAAMFPVYASCSLFGLYVLFKVFNCVFKVFFSGSIYSLVKGWFEF